MGILDRLFGRKSGKSQLESTSPPEDFLAEVKNLTGCEVLLKALQVSKQYKYKSLPERLRAWFKLSAEKLSALPPTDDELERITQAILDNTFEMYKYSSLDSWYEEILRDLPLGVQSAVIDAAEQKLFSDQYEPIYLDLVKSMDSERGASFYVKLKQGWIARAKSKHLSDWNLLLSKVEKLPIVSADEADGFLRKEAGAAERLFNIEELLFRAVGCTAANHGKFSVLVENAEIRSEPIPHLLAPHGWYQGDDAYGTNTFFAVRVGEDEYLCVDKESYG